MLKEHSSEKLGTFEYDDRDFKIIDFKENRTYYSPVLKYIGDGEKPILLPKGCRCCNGMFQKCNLDNLDFSLFNTRDVVDMDEMFSDCRVLNLDLTSFNTSKVQSTRGMFSDCICNHLDLHSFDTKNVTIMEGMFEGFRSNSSVLDISNFNTDKVVNFADMFYNCRCKYLDLPTFRVDVYFKEDILYNCSARLYQGTGEKILGIEDDITVNKLIQKYKMLGKEIPTLYRKIQSEIKYIELVWQNEIVGYRVRYKSVYYDISIEEGYIFECTEIYYLRLIDGLLLSNAEISDKLAVFNLIDYPNIIKELTYETKT